MASTSTSTTATTCNVAFDKADAPTTTPFTLPGGVKGVLVGQSKGFNATQVATLAEAQEDAVKVSRNATEEESDIVANGGRVATRKVFGGEAGGKLSILASIIRAASGKPVSAPKAIARASAPTPTSNGQTAP